MALVTDKPEELAPENDLDNIVDPDAQIPDRVMRAELQMSGKTLAIVEDPPGCGDTITLMVELEVTAEGREKRKSSDESAYYRKTRLVSCWLPGGNKPERKKSKAELDAEMEAAAAENQTSLFDETDSEPGGDDPGHDYDPFNPDPDE